MNYGKLTPRLYSDNQLILRLNSCSAEGFLSWLGSYLYRETED